MSDDTCPLPTPPTADESAAIGRMLAAKRIAVVGLSDDTSRPSFRVARYLLEHGYEILPVNPNHQAVLGRRCARSLAEIADAFDIVNVFRRPEYCQEVAQQAIAAGAQGLWLQSGIVNDAARRLAEEAGIDFIQDRCIMVEHARRSASGY